MMDVKSEPFEAHFAEIKQELIECEEPKLEQGSDLLIKIDQDYVHQSKYLQNVPINIKKERTVTDVYVGLNDIHIKQEPFEFVQPKSESELLTLLTTHCDLPTLKVENTAHTSYLDQSSNNKHAKRKFKSLKNAPIDVSKNRSMYPLTFRSSREKLFNAHFGIRCYEICYYCGEFFLNKSQFLYHLIVIHCVKKVSKFCMRKFGRYKHCRCKNCLHTIFRHPSTVNVFHSNEKFCNIYSKTFQTERKLHNHLKIRNSKNLFKCEICLKQFIHKNNLKKHVKIHTGEKPFKCEICSKRFVHKAYLNNHLKNHTGEKPFKCEICSKQFVRKFQLNSHLKIHTGEKPFKCEICTKRFIKKHDLIRHLKIHTGEKPFKCEICSKMFRIKSNLNDHLRIHTEEKPFKCEICLNQFTHRNSLKLHLKIHTGEKPFKCEICLKQFARNDNFKRHLNLHRKEIVQA